MTKTGKDNYYGPQSTERDRESGPRNPGHASAIASSQPPQGNTPFLPVIWQNCLYVEEWASDLAELPVSVIWQNCLYVDSVPVIWQNCLYVEERASDLAECLSQ